ncbi:MAG: helix-turn-helix domain-containing protein [Pseudomonadota bacterium]
MQLRTDQKNAYLVASLVGYALELKADTILRTERGSREIVQARQVAMYLAHVGLGLSLARVAAAFERDRSTVAHACHRIEEKRDDVAFDAWLETLEQGLVAILPITTQAA